MKNLKIILGVALVAALVAITFTACPGDPDPDKEWTVKFDAAGGTAVESVTVQDGETISEPYSYLAFDPTSAGFYPAGKKLEWQKDGKKYDFSEPVRGDLNLKAKWDNPAAITLSTPAGKNTLFQAISYANSTPSKYILALGSNIAITVNTDLPPALTGAGADLTIVGLTSEKTISTTANGLLLTVGTDPAQTPSISLTIGKNITLQGHGSNNAALVLVRNAATFKADKDSKITGNSSSASDMNNGYGVAGVHVDKGVFILNGGSITLNTNKASVNGNGGSAAGVYGQSSGQVIINSGSISGNTNSIGTADVYVTSTTKISVGGATTVIGELGLTTGSSKATNGSITVLPDFNGSVKINLNGTRNNWVDSQVLVGASASQINKFTMGKYVSAGSGTIDLTIDATGKLK